MSWFLRDEECRGKEDQLESERSLDFLRHRVFPTVRLWFRGGAMAKLRRETTGGIVPCFSIEFSVPSFRFFFFGTYPSIFFGRILIGENG
ncbi:hypothetical protein AKJ41_04695 [candidate division MSBL1 archaeon SCGC-AAA259O05]|uniref:Uncharacterized protein n=1 Tax=candidate division MSBL1 archaeon SCGC-AAA259O05 TaxID=1698271 RepID=A0A133V0E0_9EURY|nr:hypothetical protein AKJ41_04695 [candidate division MSBL1 archaeon SCGC-AAA259O05]